MDRRNELIFMILQFLDEVEYKETRHKLEQESKIFFNLTYFKESLENKEWEKGDRYFSSFTNVNDNNYSRMMLFLIRREKIRDDFRNKRITEPLQAMYNLSVGENMIPPERHSFSRFVQISLTHFRVSLPDEVEILVEINPMLQDKLMYPNMKKSRLQGLVYDLIGSSSSSKASNSEMASLHRHRELISVIHQILAEEKFTGTIHQLEQEAKVLFDVAYFERKFHIDERGKSKEYISAFTRTDNDWNSIFSFLLNRNKILFEDESVREQTADNASTSFRTSVSQALCVDINSSNSSTEMKEPSQCRTLVLPDNSLHGRVWVPCDKVSRLTYSRFGNLLVGLTYNSTFKLWKWEGDQQWEENAFESNKFKPPSTGAITRPENAVSSFVLETHDSFLYSVWRRNLYKIGLNGLKGTSCSTRSLPSAATCLAIHPRDANTIALGFEDSLIRIYCFDTDKFKADLQGHQKRIICLAFSDRLEVLVSSGADAQLCVWSTNGWEKQANIFLQTLNRQVAEPPIAIHIQDDQHQLLAVCERQIDIYAVHGLQHLMQFAFEESSSQVTHATYSCDGQSIYISFKDGRVGVYVATTLVLRCKINPTVYTQPDPSREVYPLVIAAHPWKPNQFALGLTIGQVHILEPLESEGEWGILPPPEDDKGHTQI